MNYMKWNCRKITCCFSNGMKGQLYIVKSKRIIPAAWMIRVNEKNGDCYVASHPENFRNWHNCKLSKSTFLHELGHLKKKYKWHFLDEIMATWNGRKYRKSICPELKWWDVWRVTWACRTYILFGKNWKPWKELSNT